MDGGRNAIINGNLEVWQRGTTFSPTDAAGNAIYTADRWAVSNTGPGRVTVSQDASVPTFAQAGVIVPFSLKVACTTAVASPAAADTTTIQTRVEGFLWRKFWQRPLVVSFWVRATQTGNRTVSLFNTGADRYFLAQYTINAANTWEFKTVVITASPSSGTWNTSNGLAVGLTFAMMAGSNFNGTAGSWQTGFAWHIAGSVNVMSSISNSWQIALVQLEVGSVATEFEDISYPLNILRCKRYFQKAFTNGVTPADFTNDYGGALAVNNPTNAIAPTGGKWMFNPEMRASPTTVSYNPRGGGGAGRMTTGAADDTVGAVQIFNKTSAGLFFASNSTTLGMGGWYFNATADAEI